MRKGIDRNIATLRSKWLIRNLVVVTVVMHTFNPSTQEAEARKSLCVRGQLNLQRKFQDSHGYTEKPCLEKQKQNKGSVWES